jgi:hypothetical protein
MNRKVFVSYAHKDTARVKPIVDELVQLGFNVWFDSKNLQGGELWASEIARAIRECDIFLLVISRASMKSDEIRREVDLAYANQRKLVLLRLDSAAISPQIAYQVSGIQWIDVKGSDWMSRLLVALGNHAAPASQPTLPDEEPPASPPNAKHTGIHIGGSAQNSIVIAGNNNTVNQKKPKK